MGTAGQILLGDASPLNVLEVGSSLHTRLIYIAPLALPLTLTSPQLTTFERAVATIHAAVVGAAIATQRRFGLAERVEFKSEAYAAVNCASPEKPGTRSLNARKPHSTVAQTPAQSGAQSRPVQPNLVDVPSRTPASASPTGSHWDVAG